MKIVHYRDVEPMEASRVGLEGARDLAIRFLITQADGAPNFSMMVIDLSPEGNTPEHSHAWEEEIFVKSGHGAVKTGDVQTPIRPGDALYIGANESHQFLNTGKEHLELICLIPHQS